MKKVNYIILFIIFIFSFTSKINAQNKFVCKNVESNKNAIITNFRNEYNIVSSFNCDILSERDYQIINKSNKSYLKVNTGDEFCNGNCKDSSCGLRMTISISKYNLFQGEGTLKNPYILILQEN